MKYNSYPFLGMDIIWWILWVVVLFWIFATPYAIPGERRRKDSALDILNKQLALGKIKLEEYEQKKKLIEK
ncbi:SHOCT domain-containing protein [Flavobacterium sp.]|uniref:SHOCT domain-containing protein n=1 Tax=Flavobacterium sp. TaxID=239 RepID=UPI00262BAA7A|nr:SHOCT domain-containing protein [Flavobacterium sp.]